MSSAGHDAGVDDGFDAHEALRTSRLRLADYLDDLGPDEWTRPSLCEGWTVRDVVAHLSLSTTETWRDFILGMIRNLGNFDRWNARSARHQAQRHTPQELTSIVRDQADSRDHSPGSSTLDQLVDLLVHGQDISRAINTPLDMPLTPAVAALEHALGSRWYGAKEAAYNQPDQDHFRRQGPTPENTTQQPQRHTRCRPTRSPSPDHRIARNAPTESAFRRLQQTSWDKYLHHPMSDLESGTSQNALSCGDIRQGPGS